MIFFLPFPSFFFCASPRVLTRICRTTCSLLGWNPTEKSNSASVGELNANCEAKIIGDDGSTELGRNQRGELWVRGQNVMKGYWRNPRATQETKTPDGWLKTGDIAYVDDNGKFHVVDRKKVRILCSAAKNRSGDICNSPREASTVC